MFQFNPVSWLLFRSYSSLLIFLIFFSDKRWLRAKRQTMPFQCTVKPIQYFIFLSIIVFSSALYFPFGSFYGFYFFAEIFCFFLCLRPPHVKSWLIGKDSGAGRDWGQEEEGMTEDEMAGWHHQLDGCESGWTPGDGDRQGGLACCDSWGGKESDMTERLNRTELNVYLIKHF